jgi:nicotinamide-nucleotide amidase
MFEPTLEKLAGEILELCRTRRIMLATAESCTGGLVAALLTSIAGSSDVVDVGFVTYSNEAKSSVLGVPAAIIARHGAVSAEVARSMAEGAITHSRAQISVAVTGIAGPGGGTPQKPVGLVYLAAARKGFAPQEQRLMLGDQGREQVRLLSAEAALRLLRDQAALEP